MRRLVEGRSRSLPVEAPISQSPTASAGPSTMLRMVPLPAKRGG